MSPPDWYEILQVSQKAEQDVIQAAYKRLAFKYHPDRDHDPSAHSRMKLLNEAYGVLSDPNLRSAYDRELLRQAEKNDDKWRSSEAQEREEQERQRETDYQERKKTTRRDREDQERELEEYQEMMIAKRRAREQAAQEKRGRDEEEAMMQGDTLVAKGELSQAIQQFSEAIRINSNSSRAYCARGRVWFAQAAYKKALADFGRAVELDPRNTQYLEWRNHAASRVVPTLWVSRLLYGCLAGLVLFLADRCLGVRPWALGWWGLGIGLAGGYTLISLPLSKTFDDRMSKWMGGGFCIITGLVLCIIHFSATQVAIPSPKNDAEERSFDLHNSLFIEAGKVDGRRPSVYLTNTSKHEFMECDIYLMVLFESGQVEHVKGLWTRWLPGEQITVNVPGEGVIKEVKITGTMVETKSNA